MTSRSAGVKNWWRVSAKIVVCRALVVALLVFSCVGSSVAVSLAPVYWNSTNPMFKISKNDHIVDVKPFDDIDFVCPFHSTADTGDEQYLIYRVSKSEYDDCSVYDPDGAPGSGAALLILNCSTPRQRRRFTILFEPFQSIPNVPEYKAGRSYYFITTSSGKRQGLNDLYQGACYYNNMKLTVRVSQGGSGIAEDAIDQDDGDYVDDINSPVVDDVRSDVIGVGRPVSPDSRPSPTTEKPSQMVGSVTSQAVHRTAHRRKQQQYPTPSSSVPRNVAIRHPHKHDKQRLRANNDTVLPLAGSTIQSPAPRPAVNMELKPAIRREHLAAPSGESSACQYSTVVLVTTVLANCFVYIVRSLR